MASRIWQVCANLIVLVVAVLLFLKAHSLFETAVYSLLLYTCTELSLWYITWYRDKVTELAFLKKKLDAIQGLLDSAFEPTTSDWGEIREQVALRKINHAFVVILRLVTLGFLLKALLVS
jgi:hypothetical protein